MPGSGGGYSFTRTKHWRLVCIILFYKIYFINFIKNLFYKSKTVKPIFCADCPRGHFSPQGWGTHTETAASFGVTSTAEFLLFPLPSHAISNFCFFPSLAAEVPSSDLAPSKGFRREFILWQLWYYWSQEDYGIILLCHRKRGNEEGQARSRLSLCREGKKPRWSVKTFWVRAEFYL